MEQKLPNILSSTVGTGPRTDTKLTTGNCLKLRWEAGMETLKQIKIQFMIETKPRVAAPGPRQLSIMSI